jgi:hypothetical protein
LRSGWKIAAKASAGLVLGIVFWAALSPSYRSLVLPPAELILRASERPAVTRLLPDTKDGVIVERADFPPQSPRPGIPLPDLTFNVIILFALFAASKSTFSNRNVAGFLLSLVALWPVHVAAFVFQIKTVYALQLGAWSAANYGTFSVNLWSGLNHFYRIAGIYAVAFALWWIFRPDGGLVWRRAGDPQKARGRKKGRGHR